MTLFLIRKKMADNYLDRQFQEREARLAKKEKAHQLKLRRFREAYIKRLKEQKNQQE